MGHFPLQVQPAPTGRLHHSSGALLGSSPCEQEFLGWVSPLVPLTRLARAEALRSCSLAPLGSWMGHGGWAPVPLRSCPSFQLGWVFFGLPPRTPPTNPRLRKEEHLVITQHLTHSVKQNTDRTSQCVHASCPNLWRWWSYHLPASQLPKALLLCPEAQRRAGASGQLLAEGLRWGCLKLPSG